MNNYISLDEKYSTTKLLTKEKLQQEKHSNYKLGSRLFLPKNTKRKGEGGLRTKGYFKKSYIEKPLISIVTVVYNGEKYLEQTIISILGQDYDNVEYIIIDGGSTDRTLDIIKKYQDQVDYWISEPDTGPFNAMNKGASLSSGEYIAFLNADDWYAKNTFNIISSIIKIDNSDYIFGNVEMYENNNYLWTFKSRLENYKYQMPIPHPSLFIKRKYLISIGFDETYNAISDYDFIIKIINKKLKYKYVNNTFTYFRVGGISTSAHELEHFRLAYTSFGLAVAIKKFLFRKKYHINFPKRIINKFKTLF